MRNTKKLSELQHVEFCKSETENEIIYYLKFPEVKLPIEGEEKDSILHAKILLIDGYLWSIIVEKK